MYFKNIRRICIFRRCAVFYSSIATNRSRAMDVPDFTRGAWKTAPKMDMVDIDLAHFKV